jgi:predicted N-acyltransferase
MKPVKHKSNDYVIQVHHSPDEVKAAEWNELLVQQAEATPFMRHEYLSALHTSGAAVPATGWTPRFFTLERGGVLLAACALYLKTHSYGEYVFDRAWANAYAQNGLDYYPKALVAVPFTPVPGARLLARTAADRSLLAKALVQWCEAQNLSSLHLLFVSADDLQACSEAGMMLRHTVQFHWKNVAPTLPAARGSLPPTGAVSPWGGPAAKLLTPTLPTPPGRPYVDFEDFLVSLSQEKRKKIRQERRKVADAGVSFRCLQGSAITPQDWDFFYRCYERTYLEHGNAPYLSRDFFSYMASSMPENWLLFVAERQGRSIAASLVALQAETGPSASSAPETGRVAYGRYWGALERVDCLHFEACYYQPLQWCIAQGYHRFEGGAQGEHKMARALLPVKASSAHWLAHPAFADAVERFLEQETQGVENYLDELVQRSPIKQRTAP